ncbi:MAG: YbaN family protein [Prevotellaceae bacterium]|jgi:uncharacterized membrane protein YbaN (DUF454 family)|nr:YbaN family protein [Prevotellaceae bacterium]
MKYFLIACGSLAVGLGILGIFLPVLPTTPFLLLAAACYAKSSPQLSAKLNNNKYLGRYIRDYRENRGIKRSIKTRVIVMLWLGLGSSILIFLFKNPWISVILACIGIAVTIHILSQKSI